VSATGAILDGLEAAVRTSQEGLAGLAELPAGRKGFERDVRLGATLGTDELPHVFCHSPTRVTTPLDFRQREQRLSAQVDVWGTRGETQESMLLRLEAIEAELYGDRSLGGLVEDLEVLTLACPDFTVAGKTDRVGVLVVELRVIR
jgi:hypothetical protein